MKHLTKQQIEELTNKLAARTRELAAQIREELAASDVQHYRDLAGAVGDTADEALARELVDVDTVIIDRHVIELRDIEAARERIHDKMFGICFDCDEAIPYERLVAYPTAQRCVRCQSQHERTYAHAGTPSL